MNPDPEQQQQPVQFPQFPQGLAVADRKQQGMLTKLISRGLKGKLGKLTRSGIQSNQSVKFGHKQQRQKKFKKTYPYY